MSEVSYVEPSLFDRFLAEKARADKAEAEVSALADEVNRLNDVINAIKAEKDEWITATSNAERDAERYRHIRQFARMVEIVGYRINNANGGMDLLIDESMLGRRNSHHE